MSNTLQKTGESIEKGWRVSFLDDSRVVAYWLSAYGNEDINEAEIVIEWNLLYN